MGKRADQIKKWLFWFSFILGGIIAYKIIDGLSGVFEAIGGFIDVIVPFIGAAVVAYLLYAPSKSIETTFQNSKFKFLKKHRRGLSVLTVYFIVAIIIFIMINFVRPLITKNIIELANNLPEYYDSAIEFLKNIPEDNILSNVDFTTIIQQVEQFNISEVIVNWVNLENIGTYVKGVVGITNVVFGTFVIIVVSIYILLERKDIKSFVKNLMTALCEKDFYEKCVNLYERTNNIFYKYIASQIFDGILVGILTSIVMNIMKIKYATLLGLMIGLFNIIPYFGAIVAVIIAILITLFTGGFAQAIWMAIVVIIIQQIDANIINPRILGNSLNISPILVILATTIGGAYCGVLGMFLGVPVAALIKIFVLDYINHKNQTLKEEGDVEK